MTSQKVLAFIASSIVCSILLIFGCARPAKEVSKTGVEGKEAAKIKVEEPVKPEAKPQETIKTEVKPEEAIKPQVPPEKEGPTVQLALKFAPEDLTTYRVVTEMEKSVKWEGPLPDKPFAFTGGATGNKVEVTFAQRIQKVDDKGNAVAQITIKGLKYVGKVKDNIVMDFDSSREKDANSPLFKLIGQRYTIELSPAGQVLQVVDVNQAQTSVGRGLPANKTALAMISPEVIEERHTIPGLPAADKNKLRAGDSWSSVKTFSFDMMGAKSYEKTYTLKEIKEVDNHQIAAAEMKAIPSTAMAEELHKEQAGGLFSKMFDTTEAYEGKLMLDLTGGKIQEYFEKLQTEWVMVDPKPEPNKEPAALRMAATRLYSIEKID
jgi:hypothetical protein